MVNLAATTASAVSAGNIRVVLMKGYNIKGGRASVPGETLTHLCCGPCANIQEVDAIIRFHNKEGRTIGFGPVCSKPQPVTGPLDCVTCSCLDCVQPWDLVKKRRFEVRVDNIKSERGGNLPFAPLVMERSW